MPTTKKPRKKYKPKRNLQDPVGYLLEGFEPIRGRESMLLGLQLKNSSAMSALMRGHANPKDISSLIAMSNMVESLQWAGFGDEHYEVTARGSEALIAIAHRATRIEKFVPAGAEICALNELLDLHDAQMNVITVNDLQRAVAYEQDQLAKGKAIRLPGIFAGKPK